MRLLHTTAVASGLFLAAPALVAQGYASDMSLLKEERDTRKLMDMAMQEAERQSMTSENIRQSQERLAALQEKLYEEILENTAKDNKPATLGALNEQGARRNQSPMNTRVLDLMAQEDGPEIARRSGLGFIAEGTIVDIRLITRVNTAIPGTVLAQVISDVLDVDQRMVVIPRGTKLVGAAAAMGNDTEGRGKIVFTKFIDPRGTEIPIAVPVITANRIGVTGVNGAVDYHWARVFGGSTALAVISGLAGSNSSNPAATSLEATQSDLMRQNLLNSLGTTSTSLLQRFVQITPDITIEEGTAAKVIIMQAILAKPWHRIYN